MGINPRVTAALWFGLTAVVHNFCLFGYGRSRLGENFWWFTLYCAGVAGMTGAVVGSPLLDRQRVKSVFRAFLRGAWTAILAVLIFAVLSSGQNAIEKNRVGDAVDFFRNFLGGIYFFFMVAGVTAGLFGGVSGLLLYFVGGRWKSAEER